jgi:hypothetical protein
MFGVVYMRKTKYAEELCEPGRIQWPTGEEARIERLLIRKGSLEEIRFSWWKNGNIAIRPLDLSEDDLLKLFGDAFAKNVFSNAFKSRLRSMLKE